ncbi:hypothetical protein ACWEK5_15795, partial [Rhodococcus koreensis]
MAPRHRDAPEVHHPAADSLRVDPRRADRAARRRDGCRLRPRRVVAVPPARERRQYGEAGVGEDSVVDGPQHVEQVAVDAV